MSPFSSPRIAIIGAGPAGLTLALLLRKHGQETTIYDIRERPTQEEFAQPSGMLDLHEESGLAAIRACGLWDAFVPLTAECAEFMIIADSAGTVTYSDDGSVANRPEISRNALTALLVSALPDNAVHWGVKLLSVATDGQGKTTLDLGAHGTATYDLVVGGDGAWSRVRELLTDEKPRDVGVRYATLVIPHISDRHPELASLIGPGTFFSLGSGRAIVTHRAAQDSAWIYAMFSSLSGILSSSSPPSTQTIEVDPSTLKTALLEDNSNYAAWSPALKQLVGLGCDATAKGATVPVKPLVMLPTDHTWPSRPGLTLIGDAAHAMTPFAGEGVNLAMWDALELADALRPALEEARKADTADGPGRGPLRSKLSAAVEKFEAEMFRRVRAKAEMTWAHFELMFRHEDGAEGMAQLIKGFMAAAGEESREK